MEPIIIRERGIAQEITIEEIAELHEELMDGKPCICVSCSFRAAQLAFSKLWRENAEIPKREEIKIISTLPTDGSQQTFKFFEQRRIVEFGILREATVEERARFEAREREVGDRFLSFPEEELFFSKIKVEGS